MAEKKPDQSQVDKFRDLARELECDEDEERFEETVKKVVKAPRDSLRAEGED